ncbi:uncharacterized protein METZ01_LOCUS441149 [marine metagenome]|uniref:methylmalonyl-CoA epimerase n=1 Tax=marine metagenome TaxID=408172 RepID=A0A382YZN9_9ZZZZ
MLKRLNHVAIVVPDLRAAAELYRDVFGAQVSERIELALHGVSLVIVELSNSKIELMHPLGEDSPLAKFLLRNQGGGIHHICFEVSDIVAASSALEKKGMKILGDGKPTEGAHGNPVVFLHPKDFCGTLIELEQV